MDWQFATGMPENPALDQGLSRDSVACQEVNRSGAKFSTKYPVKLTSSLNG